MNFSIGDEVRIIASNMVGVVHAVHAVYAYAGHKTIYSIQFAGNRYGFAYYEHELTLVRSVIDVWAAKMHPPKTTQNKPLSTICPCDIPRANCTYHKS